MRDNFETIQLERKGDHLLVVTLNRPKAGNSMNTLMGEELRDLWSGLYCDQEDVRCAVLTGPATESSALVPILKSATV